MKLFDLGNCQAQLTARVCYPFFRLCGFPSVRILYAIEDAAALVGIYFTLRIVLVLMLSERLGRLQTALRIVSVGV